MFPFRRYSQFKAAGTPTINWGHPLASNLIAAWVFSGEAPLAAGTNGSWSGVYTFENLVIPSDFLSVHNLSGSASNPGWRSTDHGICVDNKSNNISEVLTSPSAALQPTDMVTIFWCGVREGANTARNPPLAAMGFSNSTSYGYGILTNESGIPALLYVYRMNGALQQFSGSSSGKEQAYGRYQSAGLSVRAGLQEGYCNGIPDGSAATNFAIQYGSAPPFVVNAHPVDTTSNANSSPMAVYVWHRYLSASEHQWLHQQPLAMLDWRKPRTLLRFTPAAAAGAFTPYFDPMPELLAQ